MSESAPPLSHPTPLATPAAATSEPTPLATPAAAASTASAPEGTFLLPPASAATSTPCPTHPVLPASPPSPPNSSPEQLDWGTIDDDDGAYGLCTPTCRELGFSSGSPRSAAAKVALTPKPASPLPPSHNQSSATNAAVKILSRSKDLHPVDRQTEAPAKLKSVLVVPDSHKEARRADRIDEEAQRGQTSLTQEWKLVKSKRGKRAADQASSPVTEPSGALQASASPGGL
jgi:hypothetical protein